MAGRAPRPARPELSEEDRNGLASNRAATLNRLLFPGPTRDLAESRELYGDVSVLPTRSFLYGLRPGIEESVEIEEGKTLLLGMEAIGSPDERGFRTVMCTINGQLRPVSVRDRAVASDVPEHIKADPSNPGHVAAPFDGSVTPLVAVGEIVEAGATVATIEAMKMEASITAPISATVKQVTLDGTRPVEGGDLLLVLEV